MNIKNIHLAYYSATFSTRRIVREIASQFEKPIKEYDITSDVPKNDISLDSDGDLLIVGVPSYAGRVPEMAARSLKRFLGNNTPAIIVCAYGNRAYDDTLIELKDIVEAHGFKLVSAAAVVAQHSIFPKVAEGRPDADDMEMLHIHNPSASFYSCARTIGALPIAIRVYLDFSPSQAMVLP